MNGDGEAPAGENLTDAHYARGDENYAKMLDQVAKDGHECPFCTMAVHPKPILHHVGERTAHHWFITERHEVPEGVEHYYMIIPGRHIENYREMTGNDHLAVQALVEWAEQEHGLHDDGFGLTIRSGVSERTGATVRHIHFHFIVPEIDEETGRAKPYFFPIG